MTSLLLVRVAMATPTFESDNRKFATDATLLWARLETCAGRSAPAHAVVRIQDSGATGWPAGRAFVDAGGLDHVELDFVTMPQVLMHELAHAWSFAGATKEALADVLADCAAVTSADKVNDDGRDIADVPDPESWTPHGEEPDAPADTRQGYAAGGRLLRSVLGSTSLADLFALPVPTTWAAVSSRLEPASARGLDWYLAATSSSRSEALADPDYDGLTCLTEWIAGTDPTTAYSPGRRVPDGLPLVEGAVAVPRSAALCMEGSYSMLHSFRMDGRVGLDELEPDGGPHEERAVGGYFIALARNLSHSSGNIEVLPKGPRASCTDRRGVSILRSENVEEAEVAVLADALQAYGVSTPVAVWVGGSALRVGPHDVVTVPVTHLRRAIDENVVDWLAALIVTMLEGRSTFYGKPGVEDRIEALARHRTGDRRHPRLLSRNEALVAHWEVIYDRCPDAWQNVLDHGTCADRSDAPPKAPLERARTECARNAPWLAER